ncbi:MAG: hypothetical protein QOJ89_554 [bacterium]
MPTTSITTGSQAGALIPRAHISKGSPHGEPFALRVRHVRGMARRRLIAPAVIRNRARGAAQRRGRGAQFAGSRTPARWRLDRTHVRMTWSRACHRSGPTIAVRRGSPVTPRRGHRMKRHPRPRPAAGDAADTPRPTGRDRPPGAAEAAEPAPCCPSMDARPVDGPAVRSRRARAAATAVRCREGHPSCRGRAASR